MTPKLRLREQARKALLSWMRKFRLPGKSRTRESTQMMAAPKTQAGAGNVRRAQIDSPTGEVEVDVPIPLTMHMIHPLVSLLRPRAASSMAGSVDNNHRSVDGIRSRRQRT